MSSRSFSSRKEPVHVALVQSVCPCSYYTHLFLTVCAASADRRPVDPPPMVELRIYEGEEKNDVTFTYKANFLLFTTLEHARPMAQGRVPVTQNVTPVLTGMPVAGMAYLDRPTAAGYFIFPDLSVRHEGKYRLSFHLYEELKDPKDADVDPPEGSPNTRDKLLQSNPMAPRAHVHYRLEVKSAAFDVYSAKKFPGLSESTQLSRMVAEQGCRVRIRRDVRMRRRDKGHENYQELDDEGHYARSERFPTPQQSLDRPRSISHGSIDVQTPYSTGRAPSVPELGYFQQPYQHPPPPAHTPSASSYHSHLAFGGPNAPHYQAAPPPPTPVRQSYVQSNDGFQYTSPVHTRQMSAPQNYGCSPVHQHQSGSYVQPTGHTNDSQISVDYRRASAEMSMHRQQVPMTPYYQAEPMMGQQFQDPTPSRSLTPIVTNTNNGQPPSLPSVNSLIRQTPLEPKLESISAMPQGPHNPFSPSYTSASYDYTPSTPQSTYSAITSSPSTYYASTKPPPTHPAPHTKRSYGSVFDTSYLKQPMHSGMRPSFAHTGKDTAQIETDDGFLDEDDVDYEKDLMKPLIYRRADGTRQAKKCPSPRERSVILGSSIPLFIWETGSLIRSR